MASLVIIAAVWLLRGGRPAIYGTLAGLVAIIPLYIAGLLSSYFATRLVITQVNGQSAGILTVLVFGAGAVQAVQAGLGAQAHLSVLAAFLLLALFFAPPATAAALRLALE